MLISALLFYKKFKRDLEEYGFVFNPYDPCVANKNINDKQQTIRFHIDDLVSSHVDEKVNDEFLKRLTESYGKHGEVTITRGNKHDYLGMVFEYVDGEVHISMVDYIKSMLKEFPVKFKKNDYSVNPASMDLFKDDNSKKLNDNE